jgi:hypothetical protein
MNCLKVISTCTAAVEVVGTASVAHCKYQYLISCGTMCYLPQLEWPATCSDEGERLFQLDVIVAVALQAHLFNRHMTQDRKR